MYADIPLPDKRVRNAELLPLIELDPQLVVKGVMTEAGFVADDVVPAGTMRETCPYCQAASLQLVLRYGQVIRSHLFCSQCTRCFDAIRPDGRSALAFAGLSVD